LSPRFGSHAEANHGAYHSMAIYSFLASATRHQNRGESLVARGLRAELHGIQTIYFGTKGLIPEIVSDHRKRLRPPGIPAGARSGFGLGLLD